METNQLEVTALVQVVRKVDESVKELNELELALVGGGVGEISLG